MELWGDKEPLPIKATDILKDVAAVLALIALIGLLLVFPLAMGGR